MKKLALLTGTVLATIALLLLAWQLRSVIAILLVAILLATTMSGFVMGLVNRGWSPGRARIAVIVGALLFILFFGVVMVYAIGERLPQALTDFRTIYGEMRTTLMNGNRAQAAIAMRMPSPYRLDDLLLGSDGSGLLAIFSGISSTFGAVISNFLLVIFVALYWVADRERIERLWLSLLAPKNRSYARNLVYEIENETGSNLRIQIVQYIIALVLLILGYILLGLKYPLLMAWIVSILWFVPLIGAFLSLVPVFLLGLINGYVAAFAAIIYTIAIFVMISKLLLRFRSLRQRHGSILGLMVIIALVDVMGIFGLIMAMPMTVAIHVVINHFLNVEAAPVDDTPELQAEILLDNLEAIQARVVAEKTTISPRTMSMFKRLDEMVTEAMDDHPLPVQ